MNLSPRHFSCFLTSLLLLSGGEKTLAGTLGVVLTFSPAYLCHLEGCCLWEVGTVVLYPWQVSGFSVHAVGRNQL